MTRPAGIEDILRLYDQRGGLAYGEDVTQTEHALQCAALAQAEGCAPSLVLAALLHDIGHLFENEEGGAGVAFDDRHQVAGARALAGLFGAEVCEPIALHVAAKRYLCFSEMYYFSALSSASKQSLKLQGGPFDAEEAAAFRQQPYWREAITLRRFDDMGKRDEMSGRSFADFVLLMRSLRLGTAPA